MKKGYVRTEIIKFLNIVEKKNGEPLSVQDIFNLLPDLFEHLKSNPENELDKLTFDEFRHLAEIGYVLGQQKAQFGV